MTRVNHATRGVSQLGLSCEARNHRYRVNPEGARARWGLSQVVHPCTSIDTWQRDVIGEGRKEREEKRKKEKRRVVWNTRVTHSFRNVTPLEGGTGGPATTSRGLKGGKKKCWRVVTL